MLEKYETPEVEFVEMEEEDIVTASYSCSNPSAYDDYSYGQCVPKT